MSRTATDELNQRYGARTPHRRLILVAFSTVLVTAGLAWLTWVIAFHGRPMARSDIVSFAVVNQHEATATVAVVRRDREVEASCLLRAQAADHSIVGELSFRVGASHDATTTLTRTLRTEREATSVSLVGCVAAGQTHPR